jgi:hypothetical protein
MAIRKPFQFGKLGYVSGPPFPPKLADAYVEYTGIPAALQGGLGMIGIQIAIQAPQAYLLTQSGLYPNFWMGLAFEVGAGIMLLPAILVVIDPGHKIEGQGLDETAWYKRHVERQLASLEGFWDIPLSSDLPGGILF